MSNPWLLLVIGVVLGGIIGYLLATSLKNALESREQIEREGRLRAAEGMVQELREQVAELRMEVQRRQTELTRIQSEWQAAGEARADAEARLAQVRAAAEQTQADLQRQLEEWKSRAAALQQDARAQAEQRTKAETALVELQRWLDDSQSLRKELQAEKEARARAETQLTEAQRSIEEQRQLLEHSRQKMSEAFQAMAAEALSKNSTDFLQLAKTALEATQAQTAGELDKRQEAIAGVVSPLREALQRYEKQVQELENARQKVAGSLEEQLRTLQKETSLLARALRAPQVRGRWGEMTLRRVAELAGMVEKCDFVEQETLGSAENGRQRPDMIVNLPGGRRIAVDSKVPLQAYIDAAGAETDEDRRALLAQHARQVRAHIDSLSSRQYWDQFEEAPEMVILFLPGESFYSAALEHDATLLEDGLARRVLVATPINLIALLRAIAYGWRQQQMEENAKRISELGRELYDRLETFVSHLTKLGGTLQRSVDTYNDAVGSFERRVMISARRFRELGVSTGEQIPLLEAVDHAPRKLSAASGEE